MFGKLDVILLATIEGETKLTSSGGNCPYQLKKLYIVKEINNSYKLSMYTYFTKVVNEIQLYISIFVVTYLILTHK